ncbi:MAG: hypothetical protein DRO88_11165 [Promethearchaeia archaeon]|nr:MAG: hypothetical protein DRO88_11165 [Candidatus Lokiarchaeia archaeon]
MKKINVLNSITLHTEENALSYSPKIEKQNSYAKAFFRFLMVLEIRGGTIWEDGKPCFIVAGEYPYYRDATENWEDRLTKLKELGCNTIHCAVPWRHHSQLNLENNSQEFDFEGRSQANRNLKHFLQLCQKMGFLISLSLGPFSDPSLTYGGMPDFVNPQNNPNIESYRNHLFLRGHRERSKNRWKPLRGEPLPSPYDRVFLQYLQEFFAEISQNILQSFSYPKGRIIFLQLGYQGFYAEGKSPYWVIGDYSVPNIHAFWKFLHQKYTDISRFNKYHHTPYKNWSEIIPPSIYQGNRKYRHFANLLIVNDWIEFNNNRYINWLRNLRAMLHFPFEKDKTESFLTDLSKYKHSSPIFLVQWESPMDLRVGLDVWLTRVNLAQIERETGVICTFTHWSKAENYHRTSYARHSIMMKYAKRANNAINWGLRKHSSTKFEYAFTSLYQTLLSCSLKSPGYSQTPIVASKSWDAGLDRRIVQPYPTHAAIDVLGISGNKFKLMEGINRYFGKYFGSEFLETKQDALLSIGIYMPYVQLAAYVGHDPKLWKRNHLNIRNPPFFGQDFWTQFHLAMQHLHLDYDLVNLEYENLKTFISHPYHENNQLDKNKSYSQKNKMLLFGTSFFLGQNVQRKLVNYVQNGGIVFLFGEIPEYDENFAPCTILKDFFSSSMEKSSHLRKSHRKRICAFSKSNGLLLFHPNNPFEVKKTAWFYLIDFLTRVLIRINFKLPKSPVIDFEAVSYPEFMSWLSQDRLNPKLRFNSLKTINLLLRFLQSKGINRKIDISIRTEYLFRHKIHVVVYQHPEKNIQHIFIFNLQTHFTLPVSIHIFQPDSGFSSRIQTHIVGHTAQLLRIEEGHLTACIYNGVNPISHQYYPLNIRINKHTYKTKHPIDLIFIKFHEEIEIFSAYGRFKGYTTLTGIDVNPIKLLPRDHKILEKLSSK